MIGCEPYLSIVVPAFNEADNLPRTLFALNEAIAAAPVPGELVVCDNNSTDATAEVAVRGSCRL
jgi:glycosyltransferase involved in cell wall biosynthesis